MVGTNATRWPCARRANEAARTSSSCAVQRARAGATVLATVAFAVAGERAVLDLLHEAAQALAGGVAELRVGAHKARRLAERQPHDVVPHEHLPVGAAP